MNMNKEKALRLYTSQLYWLKELVNELPDPEERLATSKELSYVALVASNINLKLEDIEDLALEQED